MIMHPFNHRTIYLSVCGFLLFVAMMDGKAVAANQPRVELTLDKDKLFIGEGTYVIIKITAPKDSAVRIVAKENYAHYGSIHRDITDPSGKTRKGIFLFSAARLGGRNRRKREYQTLPAGKTIQFKIGPLIRPQISGNHKLKVYVYPIDDESFRVVKQFEVKARKLPESSILDRIQIKTPRDQRGY